MDTFKYRIYPTLLNLFDRYKKEHLSEDEMVDRINRIVIPQTEAQAKGSSFEEAVIRGTNEDLYDAEILKQVRSLLPRPMVKTQVYCEYQLNDVLLYGYVDVIGKTLAVDIKTTSRYVPDYYVHSHQNFYLPALKARGIRTLRYVITDFQNVYQENYDQSADFSVQEKQIKSFCDFLEDNRGRITDKRIFN